MSAPSGLFSRLFALVVLAASLGAAEAAHAFGFSFDTLVATTLAPAEWAAYRRRFIRTDGRVVDIEKGGHTHSEGQGYGLLLAMRADDRPTTGQVGSSVLPCSLASQVGYIQCKWESGNPGR